MDGGAWWATVRGVPKSRTQLSGIWGNILLNSLNLLPYDIIGHSPNYQQRAE